MENYNLYIANPIQIQPKEGEFSFDLELLKVRGYIQLGVDIEEAQDILKRVKRYKANAYLLPEKYMNPRISIQSARVTAMEEYSRLVKSGKKMGSLDYGYDDILWWTFLADDIEAIENDLIPGRIAVSIDKMTGHIRSPNELQKWIKLCNTSA